MPMGPDMSNYRCRMMPYCPLSVLILDRTMLVLKVQPSNDYLTAYRGDMLCHATVGMYRHLCGL